MPLAFSSVAVVIIERHAPVVPNFVEDSLHEFVHTLPNFAMSNEALDACRRVVEHLLFCCLCLGLSLRSSGQRCTVTPSRTRRPEPISTNKPWRARPRFVAPPDAFVQATVWPCQRLLLFQLRFSLPPLSSQRLTALPLPSFRLRCVLPPPSSRLRYVPLLPSSRQQCVLPLPSFPQQHVLPLLSFRLQFEQLPRQQPCVFRSAAE